MNGYNTGDVLYFPAEEMTMIVTMVGDNGVRYYNPMEPLHDTKGRLLTKFAPNEVLDESVMLLGSITNISASCIGRKDTHI